MFFRQTEKGFTLVELLVVVAIISLLSSIVFSSLNSARAKARDARRMSDIKQIQNAVELYILNNGRAPAVSGDYAAETMTTEWGQLQTALSPYIPSLPRDPCGASCYGQGSQYQGYFAYYYNDPEGLSTYLTDLDLPSDFATYRIYAQNLEQKNDSFGFGLGSF